MVASTNKSKSDKNQRPMHVVRQGAIAANIWKRQTPAGFEYLDFSLSRSWKLKTGEREGYSQSFFENNADALTDVVRLASEFIRRWNDNQAADPITQVEAVADSHGRTDRHQLPKAVRADTSRSPRAFNDPKLLENSCE